MRIILLLLLIVSLSMAQAPDALEQEWRSLSDTYLLWKEEYERLAAGRDSLLRIIDAEKARGDKNEAALADMMAEGLRRSELLDQKGKALRQMQGKIARVRAKLYQAYTEEIERLKRELKAETTAGEKERMAARLSLLQSRRLYVSPLFPRLTFDIRLLHSLALRNADSTEQAIYRAYLFNALSEIDSSLTVIRQKKEALEDMLQLEEKSRAFIADIEDVYAFDDVFSTGAIGNGGTSPASAAETGVNVVRSGSAMQASPLLLSLNRLNSILIKLDGTEGTGSFAPGDTLSGSGYLRALKEGQAQLVRLRREILQKLKSE